jgi:alpha-aminoadipate carrier protein LysW
MRPFPDLADGGSAADGARMATCPECEFDEIETAEYEEGDTFSCPECGKNLVLLAADEVEVAGDEDEDLDDDDEEEDEEDEDDDVVDDEDEVLDEEEDVDE